MLCNWKWLTITHDMINGTDTSATWAICTASGSPTLTNVPEEQNPKPQNTPSYTVQPTPAYDARHGRRERRCSCKLWSCRQDLEKVMVFHQGDQITDVTA